MSSVAERSMPKVNHRFLVSYSTVGEPLNKAPESADPYRSGAPIASSAPSDSPEQRAGEEADSRLPSLWPAWLGLLVAVVLTAVAQYFAPQFDYQNANLLGLACLALGTLYFLFTLQRRALRVGHPWRLPAIVCGLVALFFVAFQFQGFSGEMFPLFRFRLASDERPELQAPLPTDDAGVASAESAASAGTVSATSPQFLGPQRNAVYPTRAFAVPESGDELNVLWDQGIGAGWSSFAVDAGLAITLEQRGDQECLTAYRLRDGGLLWIIEHHGRHDNPLGGTGPRSTPTIADEKVYATTATGWLCCAERDSGEIIWSKDLLDLAGWDQKTFETAAPWGYACSPLLVDGLCVVPLGGPPATDRAASLVALDADQGDLVWKSGDDQLSYASPMLMSLDGQRQIVSVNEKTVSGHGIQDGAALWSFSWPGSSTTGANCASAVPVGADKILVGKGYGGGSALVQISREQDDWKAEDVWRSNRVLKTKFNHTAVQGDVGYGISNGMLQAVALQDASIYWNQPRSSRAAQGQAVLVEDTLVVQDEAGEVVFVDATPEGYVERARFPALNAKTWNIPTVAGRYLLVRNDRQAICFELPAR